MEARNTEEPPSSGPVDSSSAGSLPELDTDQLLELCRLRQCAEGLGADKWVTVDPGRDGAPPSFTQHVECVPRIKKFGEHSAQADTAGALDLRTRSAQRFPGDGNNYSASDATGNPNALLREAVAGAFLGGLSNPESPVVTINVKFGRTVGQRLKAIGATNRADNPPWEFKVDVPLAEILPAVAALLNATKS